MMTRYRQSYWRECAFAFLRIGIVFSADCYIDTLDHVIESGEMVFGCLHSHRRSKTTLTAALNVLRRLSVEYRHATEGDLGHFYLGVSFAHKAKIPDKAGILLPKTYRKNWSGRRDSNPRPQPWQGCALPLSYTRSRQSSLREKSFPLGRRYMD